MVVKSQCHLIILPVTVLAITVLTFAVLVCHPKIKHLVKYSMLLSKQRTRKKSNLKGWVCLDCLDCLWDERSRNRILCLYLERYTS